MLDSPVPRTFRFLVLGALCATLSACDGRSATSPQELRTQLSRTAQNTAQAASNAKQQFAQTAQTAKKTLTAIGETTLELRDKARDKLQTIGSKAQSGAAAVKGALESVGELVLEATGSDEHRESR